MLITAVQQTLQCYNKQGGAGNHQWQKDWQLPSCWLHKHKHTDAFRPALKQLDECLCFLFCLYLIQSLTDVRQLCSIRLLLLPLPSSSIQAQADSLFVWIDGNTTAANRSVSLPNSPVSLCFLSHVAIHTKHSSSYLSSCPPSTPPSLILLIDIDVNVLMEA